MRRSRKRPGFWIATALLVASLALCVVGFFLPWFIFDNGVLSLRFTVAPIDGFRPLGPEWPWHAALAGLLLVAEVALFALAFALALGRTSRPSAQIVNRISVLALALAVGALLAYLGTPWFAPGAPYGHASFAAGFWLSVLGFICAPIASAWLAVARPAALPRV
jgi:hypothetical protein